MGIVYLAGPLSDGEDEYAWHKRAKKIGQDLNFINPFQIHDKDALGEEIYAKDITAIKESQALLLRRIDNYEVCGAYIESGIASVYGIETFVWNDAYSPVPEFLEWHSKSTNANLQRTIEDIRNYL